MDGRPERRRQINPFHPLGPREWLALFAEHRHDGTFHFVRPRCNFYHFGSLCLTMGILAFLIAAALLISTPADRKPMKKVEQTDQQGFAVKGLFNTNYGLNNGTALATIESLDEMKQQVGSCHSRSSPLH